MREKLPEAAETPNKSGKGSRRRIVSCILLIIGLIACPVIGYLTYSAVVFSRLLSVNSCPLTNPSEVENLAEITLPPNYSNLWSWCMRFQGVGGWVTFTMQPGEVDALISSSRITPPLATTTDLSTFDFIPLDAAPPEIKADFVAINADLGAIETYLYGEFDMPGHFQRILIDTSRPKEYKVYIIFGRD